MQLGVLGSIKGIMRLIKCFGEEEVLSAQTTKLFFFNLTIKFLFKILKMFHLKKSKGLRI